MEFKKIATKEIQYTFGNYVKDITFKQTFNTNKVEIKLHLHNAFFELSEMQQFTRFDMAYQRLRLYLKFNETPNLYYEEDIHLSSIEGKQSMEYNNTACVKKLIDFSCGELIINDTKILSKALLRNDKQLLYSYEHDQTSNGILEKEVIEYYEWFFNMLTKGRTYYRLYRDDKLAIDAITKEFDISQSEFSRIYKKYYVLMK
ncbi:hypothetical protein [Bacillus massiliigorillae]|uniref:hypothetical protein n=1 Tax=Bacillus massiliigorillae TaxID=1243664 RepID=UPI0012B52AD4|nr:hypothetical protein [Bacillus massiliigorillae]